MRDPTETFDYSMTSSESRIVIAPYVSSDCATDLSHPAWEDVPPNRIQHFWSGELAPGNRHAEARVCWSDELLSARFVCTQREPLIVAENPITHQKTLQLWDRDVCEIFVAPDVDNPTKYFEFEAAPTGEWVDLGILVTPGGRETDWDYQSGMRVKARIEGDGLTILIMIPWSESIPKPEAGTQWRVNLFRCVGPEEPSRYLAWQPTGTPEPNFHVPDKFGWLDFK
jgi:hypothetical protein